MAEGLNKVLLIGNLGADPELRQAGDSPVLNMRLACNESYKDRDGVRRDKTEWIDVVLWGPRAPALGGMLRKGETIAIEGSIRTRSWEKDGVKHFKTEVNASNVILLGGKGGADEGESGGGYSRKASGPAPGRGGGYGGPAGNGKKDDIPF